MEDLANVIRFVLLIHNELTLIWRGFPKGDMEITQVSSIFVEQRFSIMESGNQLSLGTAGAQPVLSAHNTCRNTKDRGIQKHVILTDFN